MNSIATDQIITIFQVEDSPCLKISSSSLVRAPFPLLFSPTAPIFRKSTNVSAIPYQLSLPFF